MGIQSIKRDYGITPSIVRILTTDNLATVKTAGYITSQYANILEVNDGEFNWVVTDTALISASDGWALASVTPDFTSFSFIAATGSGSVTFPITIAEGGTNATTAPNARTNLGLGSIATQAASAVAITGGQITADSTWVYQNVVGAIDLVATKSNAYFDCTASGFNISDVLGLGSYDNGYYFAIKNDTGAGNVTFVPDGADTIDGNASLVVGPQQCVVITKCAGQWSTTAESNFGGGVTASQVQLQTFNEATDSGILNNLIGAYTPAITGFGGLDGVTFVLNTVNFTNTGSTTFDNGAGAKPVVTPDFNALVGGEVVLNNSYQLMYNQFQDKYILLNSSLDTGITPAQIQDNAFTYALDTGTLNAYVVTLSPVPTIQDGFTFWMKASSTNTSGSTLDVNGTTGTIVDKANNVSPAGSLIANYIYQFAWQSNVANWVLQASSIVAAASPWTFSTGTNSAKGGAALSAAGTNSLAWGNSVATANAGSFVIADNTGTPNNDSAANQYNATFANGFRWFIGSTLVFTINNQNTAIGGDGTSSSTGYNSFTYGVNCKANGYASVSFGRYSYANGNYSAAFGYNSSTNFQTAFVMGDSCMADAVLSYAFGASAVANYTGSYVYSDHNRDGATDTAADQYVIGCRGGFYYYQQNVLKFSVDINGNTISTAGTADQSYSLQAPSTGFSITIAAGVRTLVLNPAGLLATGTIIMPAAPIDGQEIVVSAENFGVTALTVSPNAGQTISNAPTNLQAGTGFKYQYNLANTNWMPIYQPIAGAGIANPINNIIQTLVSATGAFTYVPTAGVQFADFGLQAGGGASGGTTGTAGQSAESGSGGGGAYQKIRVTGTANLAAITGSVGVGGTAGASGNNAGGPGGQTTLTINGGTPWQSSAGAGGNGKAASAITQQSGTPGTNGVNVVGTNGTQIMDIPGTPGGYGASFGPSIAFAQAAGGGSKLSPANSDFQMGGAIYGGGAPGFENASAANQAGEDGGQGCIIVTEYISA